MINSVLHMCMDSYLRCHKQKPYFLPTLQNDPGSAPGPANQIDHTTSISWSTQSEHLNVCWCGEVGCRGVTKCPGWMIFPGLELFFFFYFLPLVDWLSMAAWGKALVHGDDIFFLISHFAVVVLFEQRL